MTRQSLLGDKWRHDVSGVVCIGHLPESFDLAPEDYAIAQREQLATKTAVSLGDRWKVVAFHRRLHRRDVSFHPSDDPGARLLDAGDDLGLDQAAKLIELGQFLEAQAAYDVSAIRLIADEAFGLEGSQGLAQRTAGDAGNLRYVHLVDLLPRQQLSAADHVANGIGGMSGELSGRFGSLRRGGYAIAYRHVSPCRSLAVVGVMVRSSDAIRGQGQPRRALPNDTQNLGSAGKQGQGLHGQWVLVRMVHIMHTSVYPFYQTCTAWRAQRLGDSGVARRRT